METISTQFNRQQFGKSSEQVSTHAHDPQLIQAPIITRRAFPAAMCTVFAQEYRAGRHPRRSSSLA